MIEIDIELALISLCNGRISPVFAKAGTEMPYICYHKKKETMFNVFDGPNGYSATFEINVYAEDMKQADEIKHQAYESLKPLHPFNIKGTQRYDKNKALFCSVLEFSI